MDKKSATLGLLASSTSTGVGIASERLPTIPGALLHQGEAVGPEPSPAAAESLPASRWPVDEYLDEPDEVNRWERVGDGKTWAMPATPDHGDPHFLLDEVLGPHLAKGYVGSVDLKTRVDDEHEYASDTCVRKTGIDPATGRRYLEELVFEVAYKRSAKETKERARGFAKRGVRRQIGVFVRKKEVREWSQSEDVWQPLDLKSSLEDPCLARPLPIAALFDAARAELAVALALEAKGNPAILEMKAKSEKRGEKRALLTVLSARGFDVSKEVRKRIRATTDVKTLECWLRRAGTASSLEEVLDDT